MEAGDLGISGPFIHEYVLYLLETLTSIFYGLKLQNLDLNYMNFSIAFLYGRNHYRKFDYYYLIVEPNDYPYICGDLHVSYLLSKTYLSLSDNIHDTTKLPIMEPYSYSLTMDFNFYPLLHMDQQYSFECYFFNLATIQFKTHYIHRQLPNNC